MLILTGQGADTKFNNFYFKKKNVLIFSEKKKHFFVDLVYLLAKLEYWVFLVVSQSIGKRLF